MRKIRVTKIYKQNHRAKENLIINKGGAGSGKSHALAQLFIERLYDRENYKLLITRKTLPALKISAYKLFIDILRDYNRLNEFEHNKSERTLKLGNNFVHFTGIDDPEKIKSTEWNDTWMEEATDFSYEDYLMLKLRNRAPGHTNQMYLSLNPVDESSWINEKVIKQEECRVIHSTYRDNPFLPEEAKRQIENLKNIDENYYKIYALGEWGGIIKGKIFTYDVFEEAPVCEWRAFGMDFGFTNDPSTLVSVAKRGDELYISELLYETGLTNQDLSVKLRDHCEATDEIVADSAEPKSIEELFREGWNVHPAKKGPDSIRHGIDLLKRYKLLIHKDSVNLQKELNQYRWATDKNGDILRPEKPVDYLNHAIDAIRYVVLNKLAPQKTLYFA